MICSNHFTMPSQVSQRRLGQTLALTLSLYSLYRWSAMLVAALPRGSPAHLCARDGLEQLVEHHASLPSLVRVESGLKVAFEALVMGTDLVAVVSAQDLDHLTRH